MKALGRELNASAKNKRLALWKSYFFDEKNIHDGNTVLIEAMLGNHEAHHVVMMDVDADAGPAEVQSQLGDDINRVSGYYASSQNK